MDDNFNNQDDKSAVSIIVPIYNSSKYLHKCLDSLQHQTLENIEILLINDGSKDNSEEICLEYCHSDSRFRYFYQENLGVSAARNLGLENAQGEYIGFCDSDDWVEKDMYEKLYRTIRESNVDFVITDFVSEKAGGSLQMPYRISGGLYFGKKYSKYQQKSLVDDYFEYPAHISIWSGLYRKEIINRHQLLFLPVTNGEDLLFGSEIVKYSTSMYYLDHGYLYHYRDSVNSASKNSYKKLKKSYSDLYRQFLLEFTSEGSSKYEEQLLALRYQFLFILLGSLISGNYTNRFIYHEIKELLNQSVFRKDNYQIEDLEIRNSFNQRIQKAVLDSWDNFLLVMLYLTLKKRKLHSNQ